MLEFLLVEKLLNSGANQNLLAATGLVSECPKALGEFVGESKIHGHRQTVPYLVPLTVPQCFPDVPGLWIAPISGFTINPANLAEPCNLAKWFFVEPQARRNPPVTDRP